MNSRPSTPEIVCLQCGDVGFSNAFVYCVKCLKFAVHRYCLKIRPKTFDEYVRWFCDDCEAEEQSQHLLKKASRCKTRDHSSPDHIVGYSVSETKKNDIVLLMVDEPVQSYDASAKIGFVEFSKSGSYSDPGGMNNVVVGLPAANERKRCKQSSSQFNKDILIFNELSSHTSVRGSAKEKRSVSAASIMRKDHYTLGNNSGRPFKECTNIGFSERAKFASDSTTFKDAKAASIMRKDQHTLGNNSSGRPYKKRTNIGFSERAELASDSTASEDGKAASIMRKDPYTFGNKNALGRAYKECTNIGFSERAKLASDSTASKDAKAASIMRNDQHTLGNNSSGRPYEECTNIGFSKRAKFASDSTASKDAKAASIMRNDHHTRGNNSSGRPNKECTNIGFSRHAKLASDSAAKDGKAASIMRKDHYTLGNNSSGSPFKERINIGFNEHAELASDSTASEDGKVASIMRKDQYTFGNKNALGRPYKECTNIGFSERAKLASNSTASKDAKAASIMRNDQHTLGYNSSGRPYEECTNIGFSERAKFASDSTASKDVKAASIMRKDQYTLGNSSSGMPYKECTNIGFSELPKLVSDSTASKDVKAASIMGKDQHTLGNNSCRPYKECTHIGYSERAELASDSTAFEGVKENKTSLKRDHNRFYQQHNGSDPETSAALPPLSPCSGSVGSSKKMKPDVPFAANLKDQERNTFFAQHLKKHKGVILGTQCSGITTDRRGIDPIRESSEVSKEGNSESKHVSYSCKGFSKESTISPIVPNIPAEPIMDPIWRGSFNIWNKEDDLLEEVMGHLSILACQKVYEEASQFTPVIHLEMLSISQVWPKSFKNSEPSADSIAIYFFPSERSERVYDDLVNELVEDEVALKAIVQNADLLVFPSTKLPLPYWRFRGKYYLWGVFVEKESPASSGPESRYNPVMHKDRVDNIESSATRTDVRGKSPVSPLSNCSSYGSHIPHFLN